MNESVLQGLQVLGAMGSGLRSRWHFDWPESVQQAIHRLRFDATAASSRPIFAAILGGASSGKSTVFDNLLGGRLASGITARGHTTLGPICAAHEADRPRWERLLDEEVLLPGLRRVLVELDDNTVGAPDAVAILFHVVDGLEGVALLDLPDFTSESAHQEGDLALALLPWFDRIVVVVDPERWFDRQSVTMLRSESTRLGQQRWVLFNRVAEGTLCEEDRSALAQQGQRLAADGMDVLALRHGRGLCLFPPGTLDGLLAFLKTPAPGRTVPLLAFVADAANRVLNQNEERTVRIEALRAALHAAVDRTLPAERDCLVCLATAAEREQLEWVSRVLGIRHARHWFDAQTRRLRTALGQVPLVGAVLGDSTQPREDANAPPTDRRAVTASYFETVARRQAHEIRGIALSSAFWDEVRRWTGIEPTASDFAWDPGLREEVRAAADAVDAALHRWAEKVEAESSGLSPHLKGAVGAGAVALAIVLIAAPGPVVALTLVTAKGAIGAALTHLAAAAGAGALAGRPLTQMIAILREKLIGSAEFDAVREAVRSFRALLEKTGRGLADRAITEASSLVMGPEEPLKDALERLREPPEPAS